MTKAEKLKKEEAEHLQLLLTSDELKQDPVGFLNKHWGVPFEIGSRILEKAHCHGNPQM
jgi:hypothetical protein